MGPCILETPEADRELRLRGIGDASTPGKHRANAPERAGRHHAVLRYYRRGGGGEELESGDGGREDFYARPHFDDCNFFGQRRRGHSSAMYFLRSEALSARRRGQ